MPPLNVLLRRLAQWGARSGPEWWLRHLPAPIGSVARWFTPRQWRRIVANQVWITGKADQAPAVFRQYAHCLAESFTTGRELELEIYGKAHLPQPNGTGGVLLTAHTGAWELAAAALVRQFGSRLTLVLQREPEAELWSLHEQQRNARGLGAIAADQGPESALQLLNQVRAGGWVALQADRPGPSRRSLRVELFGRAFSMPEGPFRIAKLSGAPLVPVFNARLGFMRYRIEVFTPIYLAADASGEDLARAAQAAADCLQDFVGRYPTQWFHFCDPPTGAD